MTWFFLAVVFAATGWISWKLRRRRRAEPNLAITWQPAPEAEMSEPYAAEKLRELGLDHLIEKPYRGRRSR